jgi:two-component system invasion response regulator UvrY
MARLGRRGCRMPAKILIVEDHDAVRRSLRDWLKVEFPQCRVIEAVSGEEAMALTQIESPHLVVMDITLPGMSGIEATRQIKATLPSAQIVMLTVHEDETYRADATAAGASAYVPKRAMQTELVRTLAALLANTHD